MKIEPSDDLSEDEFEALAEQAGNGAEAKVLLLAVRTETMLRLLIEVRRQRQLGLTRKEAALVGYATRRWVGARECSREMAMAIGKLHLIEIAGPR